MKKQQSTTDREAQMEIVSGIKSSLYQSIINSFSLEYDGKSEEIIASLGSLSFKRYTLSQYNEELREIIEELVRLDDLNISHAFLTDHKKTLMSL